MKREPEVQNLLESSWRRELTPEESACLRARLAPEADGDGSVELDRALTRALQRLPDAEVSSNFTARVLQEATRPEKPARSPLVGDWWRRWLPRAALAAVVLGAGLLSWNQVQTSRRLEMVESLATVAEVSSLPSPEILQDFEAIRALSQAPPADEQLLTLLQ